MFEEVWVLGVSVYKRCCWSFWGNGWRASETDQTMGRLIHSFYVLAFVKLSRECGFYPGREWIDKVCRSGLN
jgi:hypothetical protein